jgi:hypothetical protein
MAIKRFVLLVNQPGKKDFWINRTLVGLALLGLVATISCGPPQSTAEIWTSDVPTVTPFINENKTAEKQSTEVVVPATRTSIVEKTEQKQTEELNWEMEPTRVVADILANPATYRGKEIAIVGNYEGWDWQGKVGTGPPVTRSDWVIADASGAIYVVARDGGAGALGQDSANRQKVIQLLVKGVVRISRQGQPYIEPSEIKILEK